MNKHNFRSETSFDTVEYHLFQPLFHYENRKFEEAIDIFGLGQPKCPQCGMSLNQNQIHEWNGKKFCSDGCKRHFRLKKNSSGGSCH